MNNNGERSSTIETLKQALEALEKSAPVNQGVGWVKHHNNAKRALRTAIAEAEKQEPVAWLFTNVQSGDIEASCDPDHKEGERELWYREPLVRPHAAQTRPATREEKIVRPGVYEVPEFNCPRCGHCCSQREWVSLTHDEIKTIWRESDHLTVNEVCRAIEAKLREKNGGQG